MTARSIVKMEMVRPLLLARLQISVCRSSFSLAYSRFRAASLPLAYKIAHYFGLTIEEVFDFSDLDEEQA